MGGRKLADLRRSTFIALENEPSERSGVPVDPIVRRVLKPRLQDGETVDQEEWDVDDLRRILSMGPDASWGPATGVGG